MMRSITLATAGAALCCVALSGCSGSSGPQKARAIENDPKTLVAAGFAAIQAGNDQAALSAFEFAVVKDPTNYLAQYNVGALLQKRGDNVDALESYKNALAVKPDYVPALYNEATIFALKNPKLAEATYKKVISLQPIAPTAYLNLGLLEAAMNRDSDAKRHFAKAIEQDGTLVNAIPKDVFTRKTPVKAKPLPTPKASAASPSASKTP